MLPEKFAKRMKELLGDEYEEFREALECRPEEKGLRINRLKCDPEKARSETDLEMIPLDYAEDGYLLVGDTSGIGNTPMHVSGRIYIQDPGAMSSVSALDVKPGMRVADLCAAPGGKSSQLAALMNNEGFLLSNEYVPKRAKILVSNYERMGIRCGVVTSLDTAEIAKLYENFFDVVVADAPCSGEGMFRKDNPAIEEWSEENVLECAARQANILDNAAKTVRDGGTLLYSTCTYSLEENEMTVDAFLASHPEFSLVEVKDSLKATTSPGVRFSGAKSEELYKCRRFYPHKARGEGQFLALFEKKTCNGEAYLFKDSAKSLTKSENAAVSAFFRESLSRIPDGRVVKHGENIVLVAHGYPLPERSVFSAGVLIGEVRGNLLFPSHQFFSAYGELFKSKIELSEEAAKKYIRGEEIEAPSEAASGWCALLYHGSSIGGGKISGGRIKNHFPKGLRVKS